MAADPKILGKPILILCNSSKDGSNLSTEEILSRFQTSDVSSNLINIIHCNVNRILSSTLDSLVLNIGIDWLISQIDDNFTELQNRINNDLQGLRKKTITIPNIQRTVKSSARIYPE